MSKNLEIVINNAANHCDEEHRNTIIFIPPNIRTQAYSIFTERVGEKKWAVEMGICQLQLSVANISGHGMIHFDTVYVINPQDIDDTVLNEIKMVPTEDGIVIAVKL